MRSSQHPQQGGQQRRQTWKPEDLAAAQNQCLAALASAQDQFAPIAQAHKRVSFAEEAEFARAAFLKSIPGPNDTGNFRLCFCDPMSIQSAILQVAKIGLTLNPIEKLAYLVPRRNQQRGGVLECHLDISYMGMVQLAVECGIVTHVVGEQVFQEDMDSGRFQYRGPAAEPLVTTDPFSPEKKNARSVGVWCTAYLTGGGVITTHMRRDQLDVVKMMSFNRENWDKFASEYEKKTCIKRGFKTWPKPRNDSRLAAAIDHLNQMEGFQFTQPSIESQPQSRALPEPTAQGGMAAMILAGTQGRDHANRRS